MIARIHGADLDFLIRKDRDDAVLDVDDHLLVDIGPLAAAGGAAGTDITRNQPPAPSPGRPGLAGARPPPPPGAGRHPPGEKNTPPPRRRVVVDRPPAAARCAVSAPCSGRLCERV